MHFCCATLTAWLATAAGGGSFAPDAGTLAVPAIDANQPRLTTFGLHAALNLGLALDVHRGSVYGFASGNIGLPAVSKSPLGMFAIGLGFSAPLTSSESPWYFDCFAFTVPGWQKIPGLVRAPPFIGLGVGLGFRWVHRSGFTLGFKVPLAGMAFGEGAGVAPTVSQYVATFYYASVFALPVVSLGYSF